MSFIRSRRINELNDACALLQRIVDDTNRVQIVHYACESFQKASGGIPRIVTIAVRDYGKAQTETISMHTEADIEGINLFKADSAQLDILEKKVINGFVSYVKAHKDHRWVN